MEARQEAEWVSTERRFGVFVPPVKGVAAPGKAAPGVAAPGVSAPGVAAPGVATPGVAALGVATPGIVAAACVADTHVDTSPEQGVVVLPIVFTVIELVIVNGIQSAVVRRQVLIDLVVADSCMDLVERFQYHKGSLS